MVHDRLALRKTKRLLLDWANLPELGDDWLGSMLKQHPDVFGPFAHNRAILRDVIGKIRIFLQAAWKATNMRERDWWLFKARQEYSSAILGTLPMSQYKMLEIPGAGPHRVGDLRWRMLSAIPPQTAFDRAVVYAQRMSYCEGPNCEEPFFLRGPKRERYCLDCKREARLRTRKKYWNAKGRYNRKPQKALRG
jgi:hypothetical protein